MVFGCALRAPHGGIFVLPLVEKTGAVSGSPGGRYRGYHHFGGSDQERPAERRN